MHNYFTIFIAYYLNSNDIFAMLHPLEVLRYG